MAQQRNAGIIMNAIHKEQFGAIVRSAREWGRLTQKDVARMVGLSVQTISEYERGVYSPTDVDVFLKFIKELKLSDTDILKLDTMEGEMRLKRALRSDENIAKMLELREKGMTNKQIAENLGCSVDSVYELIGKRSMAVRKAEEQNKPDPAPALKASNQVNKFYERQAKTEEIKKTAPPPAPAMPEFTNPPRPGQSILQTRKEVRIVDLDGTVCNYHVNLASGDVELLDFEDKASLVRGILDKDTVHILIAELQEIERMIA